MFRSRTQHDVKARQTIDLFDRRQLLKSSAIGFGHLAFASLLSQDIVQRISPFGDHMLVPQSQGRGHRLRPRHLISSPRRSECFFLFMKGGPSHVDTFDPKPLLDRDNGKPLPFALPRVLFAAQGNLLKSPWKFRQHGESGLPVSELFPNVAKHVDDLCILRSVHGDQPRAWWCGPQASYR